MARKGIRQKIEEATAHMRCNVMKFFENAFRFAFGKRRGVLREARAAYARYTSGQTLKARARKAVTSFLDGYNGSLVPATG